jgi:hypothetical protein
MRHGFGFLLACGVLAVSLAPLALGKPAAKPTAHTAPAAAHSVQQIALSDDKIAHYIAATPALDAIIAKVRDDPTAPDPHLLVALNAAAQHNGFADYADYESVADNIVWILTGIDPLSRKFIGIPAVTHEQAADVVADKSLSANEHKRRIAVLHAQILTAAPVKFTDNVALVTKYYDQLLALAPNAKLNSPKPNSPEPNSLDPNAEPN